MDALKVGEKGEILLRGSAMPKGNPGGLSLELSGLEPGHNYNLVLFGAGFSARMADDPRDITPQLKVGVSDAPDQSETLKVTGRKGHFFVYSYTSPPDGQLVVSLENGNPDQRPRSIRLSAFLNYRVD